MVRKRNTISTFIDVNHLKRSWDCCLALSLKKKKKKENTKKTLTVQTANEFNL